jgi:hypothetical protein
MKLIPKTRKGKNKIAEAGTDQWRILRRWRAICLNGEWGLLIEPVLHDDGGLAYKKRRWIRAENDPDFELDIFGTMW